MDRGLPEYDTTASFLTLRGPVPRVLVLEAIVTPTSRGVWLPQIYLRHSAVLGRQ